MILWNPIVAMILDHSVAMQWKTIIPALVATFSPNFLGLGFLDFVCVKHRIAVLLIAMLKQKQTLHYDLHNKVHSSTIPSTALTVDSWFRHKLYSCTVGLPPCTPTPKAPLYACTAVLEDRVIVTEKILMDTKHDNYTETLCSKAEWQL